MCTLNYFAIQTNLNQQITSFHKAGNQPAHDFWQRREIRVIHSLINCTLQVLPDTILHDITSIRELWPIYFLNQMKDFNLADTLIGKLIDNEQQVSAQRKALYSAWGRIYLQCGDVFGAERKFSEARRIRDT